MNSTDLLDRLMRRESLSSAETERLFGSLMDGDLSEPMMAAILAAFATKGEISAEIAGAATAMRRRVAHIPHNQERVVDTCGTGGDGKGTFNVSTAAALVAAACGVPVAKHGNRSVSSRSGSADVLAALGVPIDLSPESCGRALDEIGIAFLFAPLMHPAMAQVMPVRKALGVRTLFNILGPLTNPAGATRQLLGVFSSELVELIAQVLLALGSEHALVVHGEDGLDEISTTGSTTIAEVREGEVRVYTLRPEDLNIEVARPEDLRGGDPEQNARQMEAVLAGEEGALLDISLLNAGAAIFVGGEVPDLAAGVAVAREAVSSGRAQAKLLELRDFDGR